MIPLIDIDEIDIDEDAEGTTAADGLDRWAFSVTEFLRMREAGIIKPHERLELLEGDMVIAMPRVPAHEAFVEALRSAIAPHLGAGLRLGVASPLILGERSLVTPDLAIVPADRPLETLRGPDIALIIEVAVDTLPYDLGLKPKLYGLRAVPEVWIVDAGRLKIHIHRDPEEGEWNLIERRGRDAPLRHPAAPGFATTLEALADRLGAGPRLT